MTHSKQTGFTLIEVLVAMMLLTIGVGSLVAALSGAERIMSQNRDATCATEIARSKLRETQIALTNNITDPDENGEEIYNGIVYGYRIIETPMPLPSDSPDKPKKVVRIDISVYSTQSSKQRELKISTYFINNTPIKPV